MKQSTSTSPAPLRFDWTTEEVRELFALPFNDLLFKAQAAHRQYFDPNEVQLSTLMSIKTGACPEDCTYCPQSARYKTELEVEKLLEVEAVVDAAKKAKAAGATRFCMGAAWRSPKEKDLDKVITMVKAVKSEGLETCVTLGMLNEAQAAKLKNNGLDYYNHNLDTSPEHYSEIITTRTYEDRLDTLKNVRDAGLNVCAGGIVGLGESVGDRAEMIRILATMNPHPESVPINALVKVAGTPLQDAEDVDPIEFVRTIAVSRIVMSSSWVRLSAGRTQMTDEMQALCFLAGANSIFYGEKLLTTENPADNDDRRLLERLGMKVAQPQPVTESNCA